MRPHSTDDGDGDLSHQDDTNNHVLQQPDALLENVLIGGQRMNASESFDYPSQDIFVSDLCFVPFIISLYLVNDREKRKICQVRET